MEELADQQKNDGREFERLLINMKKDSKTRKTQEYIEKKSNLVEALWEEFNTRDKEAQHYRIDHPEHPYFKGEFYTQVLEVYEQTKELLKEYQTELSQKAGPSNSQKSELQLLDSQPNIEQDNRFKRQKAAIQALLRIVEQIKKESIEIHTKAYYKQKIKMLQEYWTTILQNHGELVAHSTEYDERLEYFKGQMFYEVEDHYQEIVIQLQEKLDQHSMPQFNGRNGDLQPQMPRITLPQINIPQFNGNYSNWKSFHDLFNQLIHHNENLGNAQKMYYLKANITGEPSALIQHLQTTDDNYVTAWELLNHRFNNTRLLVNTQLHTLLAQPPLSAETAEGLKKLHDTTKECLLAINNLGINTESWHSIIILILTQKLDQESHKTYEQSLKNPREIQKLDEFFQFLEARFQALESINKSQINNSHMKKTTRPHQKNENGQSVRNLHSTERRECPICKEEHAVYSCKKFKALNSKQRFDSIKGKGICTNCLQSGHNQRDCKSSHTCRVCGKKHNTLLHAEDASNSGKKTNSSYTATKKETKPETANQVETHLAENKTHMPEKKSQQYSTLLATALIKVSSDNGYSGVLRALIDQGSQATFITEDAVQRLKLPKYKTHITVSGVGSAEAGLVRNKTVIKIKPNHTSEYELNITALVLNKLTNRLPTRQHKIFKWKHIEHIVLADPTFNKPSHIDMILGAEVYASILLDGVIKGSPDTPIAQQTELGWILSGRISDHNEAKNVICSVAEANIDDQLKAFWEMEELFPQRSKTAEENKCEQFYDSTFKRSADGRYTVCIPFKTNPRIMGILGESKERATARFLQLERKFQSDKQLKADYKQFIDEFISLGHMEPAPVFTPQDCYYMPHHAVINNEKTTTKLRVVFDASAKTTNGVSLNDIQLIGPKLQDDLTDVLLRWRKHKVVYSADIEKMYRQVRISNEDKDFHRILWRDNPSQSIKEYRLTTVTYGTSSAPYLAVRTLQQLAKDEQHSHPNAASIILTDFYVDDVMSGCDSLTEAIENQQQLTTLLRKGGFTLRKWASNELNVIKSIPEELRSTEVDVKLDTTDTIKTLGVHWNPKTDSFRIRVHLSSEKPHPTKRSILSEASAIFDPLGWLSPCIITIKILFQALWMEGLTWDEKLPTGIETKWLKIRGELPSLERIKIPRWINHSSTSKTELHGFCDASEKAYAAVVYSRVMDDKGKVTITLLASKTKVTPLKTKVTLPRLELCGAVLLAKLIKQVKKAINIEKVDIHAWTDSTIVLAWLHGHPNKWKTFVANRVVEIQALLNPNQWHHTKSEDNPADLASRGISPSQIKGNTLWWSGPRWLQNKEVIWTSPNIGSTELESRKTVAVVALKYDLYQWFARFSNFLRLTRTIAYSLRFLNNTRPNKFCRRTGPLSPTELKEASQAIIKITQNAEFQEDKKQLCSGKRLNTNSKLLPLNPFIDQQGILRVGGRLRNAQLNYENKHPVIIPHKSLITNLLIDKAHKATLHGGPSVTLTHLRQQYWIISGLRAVKEQLHKCTVCYRYKARPLTQLMGDLPEPRLAISRPFTHTGVDYAGPINIRMSKGRGNKSYKGYIAIFICLSTKAIHIEAVSDLTAHAFIAALKRFISRRGMVSHLYSDNGTNFIGANKILKEISDKEEQTYNTMVANELTNSGIQWHFIPPLSPHFGGLWEAGVKSIKYHLKRIVGNAVLTYEELATVLTQIEACLNSRPLCPLTEDPESLDVLTPGHFLIGSSLLAPPNKDMLNRNQNHLTKWQLLERLQQEFWKRWSAEYLARLQQRPKWTQTKANIKPGDLVLLKDNLPPSKWALGRVLQIHPGQDGLSRVVTLKTKDSTFKRPVNKICPLPISDNEIQGNAIEDKKEETVFSAHVIVSTNQETTTSNELKRSGSRQERKLEDSHNKKTIPTEFLARFKAVKHSRPKIRIRPTSIPPRPTITEIKKQSENLAKKRKVNIPGVLMTILLVAAFISPTVNQYQEQPVQIIPFKTHPGLFFEEMGRVSLTNSEWNIIIYYDLTSYWKEFKGISECTTIFTDICNKASAIGINKHSCITIRNRFEHLISAIRNKNNLLNATNAKQERKRRSPLNIIGTIANKLFGILDEEFAQKYEEDIKRLKTNEAYVMELIKNQTTIVEHTSNIIKESYNTINDQFSAFKSILAKSEQSQQISQTFMSLAMTTMLSLLELQNVQNAILGVILDIQHGRVNPLLITPTQLRQQLQIIRGNLPQNLLIPGDERQDSILTLYKLMTVRARSTATNVIFDIKIPLLNAEQFQLFKLYGIPTPHDHKFIYIEPSTRFLIVNLHRDRFYPLRETDTHDCSIFTEKQYICVQQHPIYNLRSNTSHCEMSLLTHKKNLSTSCEIKTVPKQKYWIQLESANSWIYVFDDEYILDIVCGKTIINKELKGDGIIKLQPQCTIKQETMIISAHSTFTGRLNSSFIPAFNLTSQVTTMIDNTITPTNAPISLLNKQALAKVDDAIERMRNAKLPETMSAHDVHQYSISYLTISVLIIAIIVYVILRAKNQQLAPTTNSDPPSAVPRTRSARLGSFKLQHSKGKVEVEEKI